MFKKIEDKKTLDVLKKKNEFVVKNQNILTEMDKLEKEFNSNMAKTRILDEKARPFILNLVSKIALKEYDELSRVFLDKDGSWNMEFVDRLEEFKKSFKNRVVKK